MSTVETAPAAVEAPATIEAAEAVEAAQPATIVAPKAEEPATPPTPSLAEQQQSAKFAAISRREKALKAQERQLAQRAKELNEKFKSSEAAPVDATKYIDVESFKRNPYKFMKDHGLTMEQVAEIALNDGKMTTEKMVAESETKLQKEIRELKEAMAAKEAREQEQHYEQVVHNFKTNLAKEIADTADYELIRSQDADGVELVYEVIDADYNQKLADFLEENGEEATAEQKAGFIMPNKQACDLVEKYLLDQEKARIAKLRTLNKTKAEFEPATPKVEPSVKAPDKPTLTNTLSAQVPSKDSTKLSDEEQLREISKLIKFID